MKAETRVAGPWADKPIYMGQDLPTVLYPWQEKLRTMITQTKPDDRTVFWIFEKEGNVGKTKFSKYMCFHHKVTASPIFFSSLSLGLAPFSVPSQIPFYTASSERDVAFQVLKEQGRAAYIFDIPRTIDEKQYGSDIKGVFQAIEQIKNGMVFSTKYAPERVCMSPPHVICFANFRPDLTRLSADRWCVLEIDKNTNDFVYFDSARWLPSSSSSSASSSSSSCSSSSSSSSSFEYAPPIHPAIDQDDLLDQLYAEVQRTEQEQQAAQQLQLQQEAAQALLELQQRQHLLPPPPMLPSFSVPPPQVTT